MLTMREFNKEDFDCYCRMSDKFYQSGASTVAVPAENYKHTFEACLAKSPYLKGFIIEYGGKTAGYLLLTYTWYNEYSGETVTIDEIFVDDSFRGLGIGTKVIGWVYDTHNDYKGIQLEVRKDNKRAIELYQKLGFEFIEYEQMVMKPKEIYCKK